MMTRLERRLRSVVYQLLKDYPDLPFLTSVQRVRMAQRLMSALLKENLEFTDVSALVNTVLDVAITWETSTQVTLQYGHIEVADDYADNVINVVVENVLMAFLNDEPWQLAGYTNEQGLDQYLEFAITHPAGIENSNLFVSVWKTDNVGPVSSLPNQIRLPLNEYGTYDFTVDWGDGLTDRILTYDQEQVLHTYADPGAQQITINGVCRGFGFSYASGDAGKLVDVLQWGNVFLHNYGAQFRNCKAVTAFSALDTPRTSHISNARQMFAFMEKFDGAINNWNMSKVVTAYGMFEGAVKFNQTLRKWDLRALRDARRMFYNATAFDRDLSEWIVPQVKSEPENFATGSSLAQIQFPVWGSTI